MDVSDETQEKQHDNDDGGANDKRPHLLEAVMGGNGAELALLLEACRQLQGMHHQDVARYIDGPYGQLTMLVDALDRGSVAWIDLDEPPTTTTTPPPPNPDAAAIRDMVLGTARATILQAMAQCVAVQRRVVTGNPYGPGVDPALRKQAEQNQRVRWTHYAALPETDVESLFAYVRDHENMHLAEVVETLDAGARWCSTVLPDIRQHYQQLDQRED